MPHKFKISKRCLIRVFNFLLVFAENCAQNCFFLLLKSDASVEGLSFSVGAVNCI